MTATVLSVSLSPDHNFSKSSSDSIRLLAGQGVEGDAHCGATVQHRSRVAQDPTQPNLRQVHLIHAELFQELRLKGFSIVPGELGENITTRGLHLLTLPEGALLHIGESVVLRLTGLRNPCYQLDQHAPGLTRAVLEKTADGALVRKAGVMAVVLVGGLVRPGDPILVQLPPPPHKKLDRV
jgi:MOSC domain-containing protein YiiM